VAPYRAKTGGPLSGENAWSPIRRKRLAPYREDDWTTIGRELTDAEFRDRATMGLSLTSA